MPSEVIQPDKYQRYEQNQRDRGLKKMHLWVPVGDEERVKKYAARLRKAHAKSQA
jgi:hypothetical protein